MARKIKNVALDRAQEKQKKQKKMLLILLPVLVGALALEVPKTMKLMSHNAKPPVVSAQGAAPAVNPVATTTTPPQALAEQPQQSASSASAQSIVASVPVQADTGQFTQFERFASKDPFLQSVQRLGGPAAAPAPKTAKTPKTLPAQPKAPPAPPPSSAVISVNGELMMVNVDSDFPTSGTVFDQVGAPLFHLLSLTAKSAKVAIAGGSYADGAPSLTLKVGEPVTLQNTADGSRYTLVLEPQGTLVPAPTTTTTPTLTTSSPPVVPPSTP